jgi:hypothetical protein
LHRIIGNIAEGRCAQGCCGLTIEFLYFAQQFLEVGHLVKRINFRPSNPSFFVNNKDSALTDAWDGSRFPKNSELSRYGTMRKKIGAHGNFHHSNIFFLPGNMAGNGIGADVQNLGIQIRELLPARIEFRDLGGSGRSPI